MSNKLAGAVKSKTVWTGMLMAMAGVLQTNLEVFQLFLTPQQQGILTISLGLIVVYLRFITDSPLEDK
jgi:hypothetical protein